jgi:hypothetical protein
MAVKKNETTEKRAGESAGTEPETKKPGLPTKTLGGKKLLDLSQYGRPSGVEQVTHNLPSAVPVIKCPKKCWFRTMIGEEWIFLGTLHLLEEGNTYYLVNNEVVDDFEETDIVEAEVRAIRTKDGDYKLVIMNTAGKDLGQQNDYPKSMSQILIDAEMQWTRAASRVSAKKYIGIAAVREYPEPIMPRDVTGILDLIQRAFADKNIDSKEHPMYLEHAVK